MRWRAWCGDVAWWAVEKANHHDLISDSKALVLLLLIQRKFWQ